jgi:uncharacterized protein (DUF433 family)
MSGAIERLNTGIESMEALPLSIAPRADRREFPRYSVSEVALYLHIPERTVRSWMYPRRTSGLNGAEIVSAPLIYPADGKGNRLSFYNLVEAHILKSTRTRDEVPMSEIRAAIDYAVPSGDKHPLITREWLTEGRYLFEERFGNLLNASKQGQLAFSEVMSEYLSRIDRDTLKAPSALYPFVPNKPQSKVVTIRPGVSSGVPTITGTGISIPILFGRYIAGDSIEEMAEDYELPTEQVKDAIAYIEAA